MELIIENGDCLELMKSLPDNSIDLFICDLPYGETNCKWDSKIDLEEFWEQFRRLRKSKRTACIHFCSTNFGYTLIKSWEGGYKMDMVWKKRNKTGGLLSRNRPMRNHEMVYFFYDQAPKYNRDKYHKRIQAVEPKKNKTIKAKDRKAMGESSGIYSKENQTASSFTPPNPGSVVEETQGQKKAKVWGYEKCTKSFDDNENINGGRRIGANFEPPNPTSVLEEYELPASVFDSEKVFVGKRHHQTEKPQDILEFFLKYWSDEGDTILDPTMGSGSTGVACNKLGRTFIGFELDKKIFEVAEQRLK